MLVMIDSALSWPEAEGTADKTTYQYLKAFNRGWISRFGVPNAICTDGGDGFMTKVAQNYYASLQIFKLTSAGDNPQGNGKAERLVRSISELLNAAITKIQDKSDWYDILPLCLLVIRTTMRIHGKSPSPDLALYGWKLRLPLDAHSNYRDPPTPDRLAMNRAQIFKWLKEQTLRYIMAYEQLAGPESRASYLPGEKVYLIPKPDMKAKFGQLPHDPSPYIIDKKLGPTTYSLLRADGSPSNIKSRSIRRLIPYYEVPTFETVDAEVERLIRLSHDLPASAPLPPQSDLVVHYGNRSNSNEAGGVVGIPVDPSRPTVENAMTFP
jgi:hypothetical protein